MKPHQGRERFFSKVRTQAKEIWKGNKILKTRIGYVKWKKRPPHQPASIGNDRNVKVTQQKDWQYPVSGTQEESRGSR
jgi:hypothetical protein